MGLWEPSSEDSSTCTDLLTFAFQGPVAYDDHQPLFLDAEDPSRSLTGSQFRSLVRTLIAGLQAHHVQRGDCVLLHLGNSVRDEMTLTHTHRIAGMPRTTARNNK